MRKGFTLMEIMIVIAIISILMTITMKFGSGRIDELRYQSSKEQFVSAYDRLYTHILSSNYYEGERYDQLTISLTSGSNMGYAISQGNQTETFDTPKAGSISTVTLDSGTVNSVALQFTPYTLGCTMLGFTLPSPTGEMFMLSGSTIHFSLLISGQKKYCFTIKNDTCKLIEQQCQ